jgi:DNA-binding transcriptional LysR family regulator
MTGKLERMAVFVEVAALGSFIAAARKLNQSAPAITRLVAELEAELGVQLLIRTTRKVTLTRAGEHFLVRSKTLLTGMESAEALVRAEQLSLSGILRINAPMSFGQKFLAQAVCRFSILHEQVTLKVDLADEFIDILAGGYDMALRISAAPQDKSTIWRKICLVPRMLVASPTYVKRFGTLATAGELKHHKCLAYGKANEAPVWMLSSNGRTEQVSHFTFSCNNGDLLADLAALHEGIALLPKFIVSRHLRDAKLVQLLPDWQARDIWLTAYYPPYEKLPAKVAAFTRFIEDAIAPELAAEMQ